MDTFRAIRPAAFTFLRGLKKNNRREWFEAHRAEYEGEVREPLKALVDELDVRLARVAPEIVGDPRRSMFRIHRDIRFSKDKSPYKTNAGVWLPHRDASRRVGRGDDGGGAGYYFHLEPGQCFAAGGIWMPAQPSLKKLRAAIAANPKAFTASIGGAAFRRRFGGLSDEAMLKRVPRGYPPDHPAAKWLRHQSFIAWRSLSRAEVLSRRLPDILARDFAAMLPLVRWVNSVLGYRPATRR
jgi:uncharacterized protein (TIGR02453 family)